MASPFTIAIPTHDRRETVLLAVRSALAQSLSPEQVLVLCDGCTDGTAEALRALGDERVEVLELAKAPGFAYEHRNRSLELARGEMIMWLGDDDLLLPDHLEQLDAALRAARTQVVLAPAVAVWPDDSLSWHGLDWSIPSIAGRLQLTNTAPMSSVCVDVAAARDAGGWNPRIERAGDWDLWKRVLAGGARAVATSEPTVLHFRATGRRQGWPERVRQNSEWHARISDPAGLAALRPRLRAQRDIREAQWLDELDGANARVAELTAHLEDAARELERLGAAHRKDAPALASLSGRLEHAEAEVARLGEVERTLGLVYAGGWWRLRGVLLRARERMDRLMGRGA